MRKNLRDVVEHVTLADLAAGELPDDVDAAREDPEAWTHALNAVRRRRASHVRDVARGELELVGLAARQLHGQRARRRASVELHPHLEAEVDDARRPAPRPRRPPGTADSTRSCGRTSVSPSFD